MSDAGSDAKAALDLLSSVGENKFATHKNTRAPTIQGLLPRHDAICTFIIANPTMTLGAVAAHFQVTQPWLSIIINSEVFQERYQALRGEEYEHMVLGIAEKTNGLAHIVTDQLIEACAKSGDIDKLEKVQRNVFKALGYGNSSTNINIQNNTQVNNQTVNGASASALAKSRHILKQLHPNSLGASNENNEQPADNLSLPQPESTTLAPEGKDEGK